MSSSNNNQSSPSTPVGSYWMIGEDGNPCLVNGAMWAQDRESNLNDRVVCRDGEAFAHWFMLHDNGHVGGGVNYIGYNPKLIDLDRQRHEGRDFAMLVMIGFTLLVGYLFR